MRRAIAPVAIAATLALGLVVPTAAQSPSAGPAGDDPLPSWNAGAPRDRILSFVEAVTTEGGADFVPAEERLAVFDIDGTLWAERPFYLDALWGGEGVAALAAEHPEWADQLPYAPIVEGDYDVLNGIAQTDLMRMLDAGYGDMTEAEWEASVLAWLQTSVNETLGRPNASNTYLPMMELLDYLKANDFEVYLVTAAEEQFIRAVADDIFGIPPERVIGNTMARSVETADDGSVSIGRDAAPDFANERENKMLSIYDVTGRKPIFAAGNSDGDYWMMKWATSDDDLGLSVLVLHDDADREFDYARIPTLGGAALDADPEWVGVSMKDAWNTVFAQ
jgi:phosphoglycolate phosphatase-like HAD superfamily hydrolase